MNRKRALIGGKVPSPCVYAPTRGHDLGYPARGLAFIKHVQTEDTYRGGSILIPEASRDRVAATQFIVTAVGNYERCEDREECERTRHTKRDEHPHDLMEGDWVLAKLRSWGPTPDPAVYVIRQQDILARFRQGVD